MEKMPLTIKNVMGYSGRRNNIKYLPPYELSNNTAVLYFGSDIQYALDGNENDSRYASYESWTTENMPNLLRERFPSSHILVICPVCYNVDSSCFDTFVLSFTIGAPHYTVTNNALIHLRELLKNFEIFMNTKVLNNATNLQTTEFCSSTNTTATPEQLKTMREFLPDKLDLSNAQWILIGFSKGCIILNQFIYEIHYAETFIDKEVGKITAKISHMYFLDGDHKEQNFWITAGSLLDTFARSGICVHIHVTQFQGTDYQNTSSTGVEPDLQTFLEQLRRFGANVEYQLHFEEEDYSPARHFQVLNMFKSALIKTSE